MKSDNIKYYQSIPDLGIEGRMSTEVEFDKIGLPKDLTKKTVLDIGCNIGAFMVESLKRGAVLAHGVEPDLDWRLLCNGIAKEHNLKMFAFDQLRKTTYGSYDVVLLLSVTHLVDNPQEVLDDAWKATKELLIVEINDRLQTTALNLPKGAVCFGQNKDNRMVWHCRKQK